MRKKAAKKKVVKKKAVKKEAAEKRAVKKRVVKKRNKQKKKIAVRERLSQVVTWAGIIVIGILVVPTGLLIALISTVWSAADKIAAWLEKRGES